MGVYAMTSLYLDPTRRSAPPLILRVITGACGSLVCLALS
jgi:hypothetical protein